LKKSSFILQALFPQHFRSLPQRRLLLNIFRSIHILCFSILFGGLYFDQAVNLLNLWALGVVGSGICLFLIDIYGSGVVLFEIRGFTVLIKIILLSIAFVLPPDRQFDTLALVIIFSSFISHSPRWIRHRSLLPKAWLKHIAPIEEETAKDSKS
jgi:hypothetical protein